MGDIIHLRRRKRKLGWKMHFHVSTQNEINTSKITTNCKMSPLNGLKRKGRNCRIISSEQELLKILWVKIYVNFRLFPVKDVC